MRTVPAKCPSVGTRWLAFVGVFAAALLARLLYLQQIHGLVYFDHLVGDARRYDEWAQRILQEGWWGSETFYQAPLYPYLLAVIYKVLGHSLWAARGIQCLLGSAGCVLVALAGRRFVSHRIGLTAGWLMALYPAAIYFDGILQKAPLGFVLLAVLLWWLGDRAPAGRRWKWFAVGVVLGLLALTRENTLVLAPVVAVWLLLGWLPVTKGRSEQIDAPAPDRDTLKSTAQSNRGVRLSAGALNAVLLVLGLAVVLLPVGYRNFRVGGAFVVTTYQMGPNFYMGNHAGADGRYSPLIPGRETPQYERTDAVQLAQRLTGRTLSPREVSSYWLGRAWEDIKSNPGVWMKLLVVKWLLTWNRYEIPDTESYYIYRDASWLLSSLGRVYHFGVLCPLAVMGVTLTWSRRRELSVLYAVALALAASVAAFYVFGRYRYPLVPVLVIFAAAGVIEAGALLATGAWVRVRLAIVLAAVTALVVNWPINPERHLNAAQLGNFGATLAETGKLEEAVTCFDRAVASEPDIPRLRQFLADGLSLMGRYDEAIPHYHRVLVLQPDRPNAHFNLAVALERSGQSAGALEQYRRALEVNPSDSQARQAMLRLQNRP